MKSPQLSRFIRSTKRQDNSPCSNCATIYSGNYCPECGQESFTGAPTAVDFIYEFLTRNIFERGKMPRTIWHLLRYPGGLTVDFLEGRRQRFIRPVRLYFGLSVIYFLLLSLSTNLSGTISGRLMDLSAEKIGISTDETKLDPGKQIAEVQSQEKPKAIHVRSSFLNENAVAALEKRITHFTNLPQQEQLQTALQTLFNQAPKAMFFLVPVFAFLLKTMFLLRRIPYGAHLLFAFHYHAFLFLCLPIMLLPLPHLVDTALFICMSGYLFLAIRTTYACSRLGTVWRWILLNIFYPIVIMMTLALATLTAVLFT
jgi:hypothetical protein